MTETRATHPERRRLRGRRLTDKQAIILELVAEGLENKAIAHRLGLSEQAVKEHVSVLLDRLAANNRAALAEIATELRIIGTMDLEPEWLGYIFQESPIMRAIVRGPEHVFVTANAAYRAAAGEREIVGRRFKDVFPEGAVELLDDVYRTGTQRILNEFPGRWGRKPEEGERYGDVALQPLPGSEGVAGVAIYALDVTEHVRARQSLAELAAEELAVLDLVPSGIVVLDPTGAVMKVNRAAQRLLGPGPYGSVTAESAKPYRPRDALGQDAPVVESALARALAGEAVRDLRLRMFLPVLGRDAVVRIDAEPLRGQGGSVRGIVAVLTELSEVGSSPG